MKKLQNYKNFVIAEASPKEIKEENLCTYQLYTKDEWSMGQGYRYPEHEADNIKELKDFVDCY